MLTDLSIAIPEGTYARIAPRSGLAAKHSIDVGAGVRVYAHAYPSHATCARVWYVAAWAWVAGVGEA